jgi:hypothetical protein
MPLAELEAVTGPVTVHLPGHVLSIIRARTTRVTSRARRQAAGDDSRSLIGSRCRTELGRLRQRLLKATDGYLAVRMSPWL